MDTLTLFTYSWHIDPDEEQVTAIRIYGVTADNKNVCVRVDDFTPFVYIELPERITWTAAKAQKIGNKIDQLMGDCKPLSKRLMYKKRLYYAHIDDEGNRKTFPYLMLSFSTQGDIRRLGYKLRKPMIINGVGRVELRMHEQDASPILQLTSYLDIPTAGWVDLIGKRVKGKNKITSCDHEFKVKWKNLKRNASEAFAKPLVMGFDIEVNSTNPGRMPQATCPGDKVFQISCCLYRDGNTMDKYLLTLGEPDHKTTGDDVEILMYETEHDLLMGYTDFLNTYNPNIVVGYNILSFDIPYMIERAKNQAFCIYEFDRQGFPLHAHAKERTIKWSSGAYGNQSFQFLDAEGRVFVDLLPLVKRDFKLDNYKLKTVSTKFLGATKDPLTPQGIFKCYRIGIQRDENDQYSPKARKAMGVVGKYCVQDSALVVNLYNKLKTWIGLCEMAKTTNVPMFYLYTQGQQIKVYSQLYKFCMFNNIVVEKDGYVPKANEHYMGAHVFEPKPGVYDRVLPFDFASLYPTTIIAYNIDYSTLVTDPAIPDSMCNIIEWTEHQGCEHDETARKAKPKYVLCGDRRYRFLKEPKGVMPTVLQTLLDTRAHTRKQIKILKRMAKGDVLTGDDRKKIQDLVPEMLKKVDQGGLTASDTTSLDTLCDVLNKRQLAYKVSANSMYGAMGVTRGYLPFMPGAMCTTAMGRKNNILAANTIVNEFKGQLIYGDTDSSYIVFPHLKTAQENWDYAEEVADSVTKLFPPPMKLEFEEEIYWRFLILTKKRYMYKKCGRDGVVEDKIGKKGVLLARRDNSAFVRQVYSTLVMKIFNKDPMESILYYLVGEVNRLCGHGYGLRDFVVTKSIRSSEGNVQHFRDEKGRLKGKLGDYTVPLLSDDQAERDRQFRLKDARTVREYYLRCLPAIAQLAERMRRRGKRVDAGERIEHVITEQGGHTAKQYVKVEDAEYFARHASSLRIDYLYYLKLLATPVDDILNVLYPYEPGFTKDFMLKQYKYRLRTRGKLLTEIQDLHTPSIVLE